MLITGAVPRTQNKRLVDVLTALGLTTNLKLCLDAGDIASYPGSGTKWLDTSGGGYDFDNNGATFNGTAGAQASNNYFSGDGGDYFSYDSSIESWMQNMGKEGQTLSVLLVAYIASDDNTTLFSTRGSSSSGYGVEAIYLDAVNSIQLLTRRSGGTFNGSLMTPSITVPGLFMAGWSGTIGNANSYAFHTNGTGYSATQVSQAGVSNNPSENLTIMGRGDGSSIAPNGTRMHALAIWHGTALTSADFKSIWNNTRNRFGL